MRKTTKMKQKYFRGGDNNLKVMSWNILARYATKYHFDPNINEEECQTNNRHNKIMEIISQNYPDIVLLQEVDYIFYMSFKLNQWSHYDIIFSQYPGESYSEDSKGSFGTAIIFKKEKFKNKITYEYINSINRMDYDNKNALILSLIDNNEKHMTFVSTHLSGKKNDASENLLNQIKDKLKGVLDSDIVVIGGDLNCDLNIHSEPCYNKINNVMVQMKMVPVVSDISDRDISTCSFDYGTTKQATLIDQMYYNNKLEKLDQLVGSIDCPTHIWAEGTCDINYPSDHFPIISNFIII
jgi:mRNA deadenylase 3'-5' endonuclease subunit Ccr4